MMKIHIYAMRTWGELGNLLAAKTLAACLEEANCGHEVRVFEAEQFLPRFADCGVQIAAIVKYRQLSVPERVANYHALMEEFEQVFHADFETARPIRGPLEQEIAPLVAHVAEQRADIVVGTKGVISRLLMAALARTSHDAEVLNFVTNEGLLTLPIHRSTEIQHHFVPFESGRSALIERYGYSPDQVKAVGRLIAHAHVSSVSDGAEDSALPASVPNAAQTDLRLLVFSNRGGRPFLDFLRVIGDSDAHPSVLFIGYNDPELVQQARELQEKLGAENWHIVERLGQGDYIKSIRWLGKGRYPLLISKTGPNTMLEATYFGIPQLLIGSGLPAEAWVGPFAERHGFGLGFEQPEHLCATLESWLKEPGQIEGRREVAENFAHDLMNQQHVAQTIQDSVFGLAVREPALVSS